MANFTAVLDASVLHSAALRDLLLSLAADSLFQPAWSDLIHDEWMKSVTRRYGNGAAIRSYVIRTRRRMDSMFADALVSGFDELVGALTLPDPNDRHVLALASHVGAAVIVTYNLRHFPVPTLAAFGIEPLHPDEFMELLLKDNLDAALDAIKELRARLHRPPKTQEEYIDLIGTKLLMPRTARILQANLANF